MVGRMRSAAVILIAATASALAATAGARMLGRAAAEAAPVETAAPSPDLAAKNAGVRKAADGHFWAEAQVQGRHVRFLVDTGASSVALTAADAKRLGIEVRDLAFDRPVSTAAGKTHAAAVTLDWVSVSGVRVEDVQALVVQDGLEVSLLGMTYLGRLSRFEASGDQLILRR